MKPSSIVAAIVIVLAGAASASAQDPRAAAEAAFTGDVHSSAGLKCDSCHKGGDYKPIARTAIPALCASCHADPAYMRKFNAQVRVDQYAQYLTSAHGRGIVKGETRVAVCADCHGAHGVRRPRDARSPVAPQNVANTCAKCHADPERMKPFGHPSTTFADWSSSVHANALLKRGDMSAPTCSTCHGSHGATPPGVSDVANVCAQCHVREAELFTKSPKKDIFEAMGQAQCLACHSNHAILPPSHRMIGFDKEAVCSTCHDESGNGASTIKEFRAGLEGLSAAMVRATDVVDRAERSGMLVDNARLALHDAGDQYLQARVSIHAFAPEPFAGLAAKGLATSTEAEKDGYAALDELQFRRRGLAVATIFIVGFLITLVLKIRRLPPPAV